LGARFYAVVSGERRLLGVFGVVSSGNIFDPVGSKALGVDVHGAADVASERCHESGHFESHPGNV
jgi:hypothetical protein